MWSELYAGNQHTVHCLQPAVRGTEIALELGDRQRQRTVWRMDGGAGTDEQFCWLLGRGYHILAKGLSNFRAGALARHARRWDAYDHYELAEVPPPVDYGRPVRCFLKRRWQDGRWRHSYYLSTLQFSSKGHFLRLYHQRGAAEIEQFRNDKQGLSLAARRKSSFRGQQGYLLLGDLAHNLLADFHHRALAQSPFADYGLQRIVRDLLAIPGMLVFAAGQLKRIELLTRNQNAKDLIICLERYVSGE